MQFRMTPIPALLTKRVAILYLATFLFAMLTKCSSLLASSSGTWVHQSLKHGIKKPISAFRLYSGTKVFRDGLGKPKGYSDLSKRYVLETGTYSGLPNTATPYLVLGIESSCDDTGVSIVRSDGTVLSNIVYSQHAIHERFGGIVPGLAMAAHKTNIDRAVDDAVKAAGLQSVAEVDAVAVTKGPGLEICLRVGYRKAQVSCASNC